MPGANAAAAWKEMGGAVGILESFVDFACEVSVIVGAIALTRIVGANSAPSDFTKPSTPAFAVAILA